MKRVISLLCAVVFASAFFSSCSGRSGASDTITVYYLSSVSENSEEAISSLELPYNAKMSRVEAALARLLSDPENLGYLSPFSKGVKVLNVSITEEGCAEVDFSLEYGLMKGWQLSAANACTVMTLCAIDGIESVRFLCDGEPYSVTGGSVMTSEDVVTNELALNPIETELTLYFEADGLLVPEKRKVISRENEFIGPYVIEELISGPETHGLSPTIPKDSKLISISYSQGICTVNMSVSFLSGIEKSRQAEVTALTSICKSLSAVGGISGVRFLVDGEQLYGTRVMQPGGGAISGSDANTAAVTVYTPNRDGTALEPVGYAMSLSESKSPAELIMLRLAGGIDGCGFLSPFDGSALFSEAYLSESVFTVNFVGAAQLTPTEGILEELLIQSIVLTVTENLVNAKTVRILVGGELYGEYSPKYNLIESAQDEF